MKKNSLIHEHFKEQVQYLEKRGISSEIASDLKLEFCKPGMLQERGIKWAGLKTGVMWHVWDNKGVDTGAIGARVWYSDSSFTDNSEKPKFATPKGQKPRLYHSPLSNFEDFEHGDTIVLCESYLKADIAALCGFRAVGVSGVWGWSHNKTIIDDFSRYPWKELGLQLLISFDSNVGPTGNKLLTLAVERLSAELERYGAHIAVSYLPRNANDEDWGLDDYYVAHGENSVVNLLTEQVEPVKSSMKQHMLVMNREVAVVRELSKVVDIERGVFMTRNDFMNVAYADRKVWSEDDKPMSVPKAWLEWSERTVVERAVYRPGAERLVENNYNLWNGMGCEPIWDDEWAALWEQWLDDALPVAMEQKWFCSWWAYQLQELGTKMSTGLVLVGKSGVGKGWVAEIMKHIFGDDNVAPVSLTDVGGRFNADYASKQLMLIEEAEMPRGADGGVIYNKLKDIITNKKVRVERKGIDAFKIDNYVNVCLQGNNVGMLRLDEFDRRFGVFDIVNEDIANNDNYWDLRWGAMSNGLPEAVYAWLLEYECGTFNPHGMAPKTAAKQVMVETTHSPREQWIYELLDDPDSVLQVMGTPVDGALATAKELEFVYLDGAVPLWELDKKQVDAMSRALRLARVPMAHNGKKIAVKGGDGASKYFMLRSIPGDVNAWGDLVKARKFWRNMTLAR